MMSREHISIYTIYGKKDFSRKKSFLHSWLTLFLSLSHGVYYRRDFSRSPTVPYNKQPQLRDRCVIHHRMRIDHGTTQRLSLASSASLSNITDTLSLFCAGRPDFSRFAHYNYVHVPMLRDGRRGMHAHFIHCERKEARENRYIITDFEKIAHARGGDFLRAKWIVFWSD